MWLVVLLLKCPMLDVLKHVATFVSQSGTSVARSFFDILKVVSGESAKGSLCLGASVASPGLFPDDATLGLSLDCFFGGALGAHACDATLPSSILHPPSSLDFGRLWSAKVTYGRLRKTPRGDTHGEAHHVFELEDSATPPCYPARWRRPWREVRPGVRGRSATRIRRRPGF